jgi:hypothetical protein
MEENPKIALTHWQCKSFATEAKHPRIKGVDGTKSGQETRKTKNKRKRKN